MEKRPVMRLAARLEIPPAIGKATRLNFPGQGITSQSSSIGENQKCAVYVTAQAAENAAYLRGVLCNLLDAGAAHQQSMGRMNIL